MTEGSAGGQPGPPSPWAGAASIETVPEAARAALARVRASARANPAPARVVAQRRGGPGEYSGPGPDARDPQALGPAWEATVVVNGWSAPARAARLHELWSQVVGADNAEHAVIESFDPATGLLAVRASSTTWAESLRLMLPMMRARIDEVIGAGVVADIKVAGPTAPRWTHGRLRVKGRGPRDTYG